MKKKSEKKEKVNATSEESEAVVLIKKLQKQLVFLEKKIDTLIESNSNKSSYNRSFNKGRFSKPDHSGGYSRRRNSSEGGNFSDRRGFGNRAHNGASERNFNRDGSFDKFRSRQGHGASSPGRKPFRTKKNGH